MTTIAYVKTTDSRHVFVDRQVHLGDGIFFDSKYVKGSKAVYVFYGRVGYYEQEVDNYEARGTSLAELVDNCSHKITDGGLLIVPSDMTISPIFVNCFKTTSVVSINRSVYSIGQRQEMLLGVSELLNIRCQSEEEVVSAFRDLYSYWYGPHFNEIVIPNNNEVNEDRGEIDEGGNS